ncbi:MAG TPA: YeeE/YedE thiosulfate transporter family protein [Candidatus Limnocylindrales bacterium]|nr:YeeE/YedE thiosulfate transporter family protein [Candidatus Limnocylindrales bacterium]
MNFPVSAETARWLALPLGIIFGVLLHRGGVANYNVIVNQFRFKDFTVLKVMFTAIIVGGIGVLLLKSTGHAQYHIKPANMLGVALGATLFGVGMVLYGYCPGTGVAAMATGSLHAMVGFVGMLVGGVLYALSFTWVEAHVQSVAALGKVRLPDITGVPDWGWFVILSAIAGVVFWLIETRFKPVAEAQVPVGGERKS